MLTLVLISTVWRYSLGPLTPAVTAGFKRAGVQVPAALRELATLAVVLGVHTPGSYLAWLVYLELTLASAGPPRRVWMATMSW